MVYLLGAAIQLNCFDEEVIDCERLLRSDGDAARFWVLADDVEGASVSHSDAPALPDREAVEPLVLREHRSVGGHDLAALRLGLAQPGQQVVLPDAREEAQVLALGLCGYGQSGLARQLPRL